VKFVIILLLSTAGIEEIKLKTQNLNCGEIANAWREVNTIYQGPGPNQGNYTRDGKLMIGYVCD
jgi:hypothetical protein